jgi:hypothetical protein
MAYTAFVIRDPSTGEIYQQRYGRNGWYDRDPTYARQYKTRERAQQTIDRGNHHVTYPGRSPIVVEVPLNPFL